jgi:hypothetical protein
MNARPLLALFIFLLPFCLLPTHAAAQQSDRIEAFGGYSHTGYSVYGLYSGPWTGYGFNGWEASAAVKVVPNLAAELDFGGEYNSPFGQNGPGYSFRTYMAGPRIFGDFHRVRVYGHALFGALIFNGAVSNADGSATFAVVLGGGADYWFSHHFGVRIVQADYLRNTNIAAAQDDEGGPGPSAHFRVSTGVVFRFGH